MNVLRRLVPFMSLPLALIGCALANAMWLRVFPASVMALPLLGAASLSVLLPVVVNGIGVRRLTLTALVDLALFAFYELLVVLRNPTGFGDLVDGLVHGPSQLLSYALPLVSPRTLLVVPVALCWACGAIVGECIARGWQTVLPYLTLLTAFGLSYAATARAIANAGTGHRYDTLLGAGLLLSLLLLRAAQSWIAQEASAQDTSAHTSHPDGALPLRGLVSGTAFAVVLATAAAAVVQAPAFSGPPKGPARVPPLDQSKPLTPLSFIAGLRPRDPARAGTALFRVTLDRPASNYISIGNVDTYDGDGWTFDRTFRPSGGVIPPDTLPTLRPHVPLVTQQYTILRGPLTSAPWLPYMQRPQRVAGASVDVDAGSGMVVPAGRLRAGVTYSVRSASVRTDFSTLPAAASFDGYGTNSDVPTVVADPVTRLATTLAQETGVPKSSPTPFLQAVAQQLRRTSGLTGGPSPSTPPSTSSTTSTQPAPRPTPGRSAPHGGGTSLADVLTSIRVNRSATPEQFATFLCLVARSIGVPARLATGFRIGTSELTAGTHTVTTADAWTWVEVAVVGRGWVVLDGSPSRHAGPDQQPTQVAQPSQQPTQPPTNVLNSAGGGASRAVAPPSVVTSHHGISVVVALLLVLAAAAALAVVLVGVLLLRKRVRLRARRRRGDPRRRLLGAWQESLDVLQESGLPDLSSLTSREICAATGDRFGDGPAAQARYLGDAANAAIFSSTTEVDPGAADAAWRAHVALSRSVRSRLSLSERIGAGLRYHRLDRTSTARSPTSWTVAMRDRAASRGPRSAVGERALPVGVEQRMDVAQVGRRPLRRR